MAAKRRGCMRIISRRPANRADENGNQAEVPDLIRAEAGLFAGQHGDGKGRQQRKSHADAVGWNSDVAEMEEEGMHAAISVE